MKYTYKSLYQLTVDEINSRLQYLGLEPYGSQQSRTQTQITADGGLSSDIGSAEIFLVISEILKQALPPQILEGLAVTAENEFSIRVQAGKASMAGMLYTISEDKVIPIDFSAFNTTVLYINLKESAIKIETSVPDNAITIAKIIIPDPTVTSRLVDTKDSANPWDAYIVNLQEIKLYGYNNILEENSIDVLRANIGDILADNLIGNIRLSEDLKITNTQGSLELNSKELLIYNTDDDVVAKFNRYGTYFYDNDGIELAKFTTDEARVGNIIIDKESIHSGNFVTGALGSGFKIWDSGDAEFNNVVVRGKLTTSVFEKDTVSAVGGSLLIADADILSEDATATTITISGDTSFSVGDILRIKDGVDDEWLEVTAVNGDVYTVTRDKAGVYTPSTYPAWKAGTSIVNYGASGSGMVYLSGGDTPYTSVVSHAGSPWSSLTTHLRMGDLNGFLGYSTDVYGIAVGNTDSYLKYDPTDNLRIKGNITVLPGTPIGTPTESGLYMGSDKMGYYDADSGSEWKSYLANDGTFLFKGNASNYIEWDGITFTVRGQLNADDILAGTLTGITISGNTLLGNTIKTANAGPRIEMTDEYFIAYDGASALGNEVFKIFLTDESGIGNAGDVIVGSGDSYLKWDADNHKLIVADIESPDYVSATTGYKLSSTSGIEVNSGSINGTAINVGTINSESFEAITRRAVSPVGLIAPFAGDIAPDGWLICDGRVSSKTNFADLYAVTGDKYAVWGQLTTRTDDDTGIVTITMPVDGLTQNKAYEFLSHFDGVDGATTYTAESGETITFYGDAQLDTAQKKFGASSLLLDGDGDYVVVEDTDVFPWALNSFTVDFDIRFSNVSVDQTLWSQGYSGTYYMMFQWDATHNQFLFYYYYNNYLRIAVYAPDTIAIDTWYHIALVRNGDTITIYRDGVSKGSTTSEESIWMYQGDFAIGGLYINGAYYGISTYGWIDEFHINLLEADWTSNFTPPVSEYTVTSEDVYLNMFWYSGGTKYEHEALRVSSFTSTTLTLDGGSGTVLPALNSYVFLYFYSGMNYFLLPDLRTRAPFGYYSGNATLVDRGLSGGEVTHTLTEAEMPTHAHVVDYQGRVAGGSYLGGVTSGGPSGPYTSSVGGSVAHNNMPPYVTMNYIIRY